MIRSALFSRVFAPALCLYVTIGVGGCGSSSSIPDAGPCEGGNCPTCSSGEVSERCQCGLDAIDTGYCCESVQSDEPCCTDPGVTLHVDPDTGDDNNDGLSWDQAKQSLASGVAAMTGGDHLILRDGVYLDSSNTLGDVPSGSPGCWTTVRAENDFGVTIDGDFTTGGIIWLTDRQFVEILGINVRNAGDGDSGAGLVAMNSHHIKFINCSGSEIRGAGHAIGFINVQYGLVEGCHAWGSGRYFIGVSSAEGSQYLVFRRNVVRFDYATAAEPLACFAAYHQQDIAFQNNIAIDSQANFAPRLFRPACEATGTCSSEDTNERFVRGFFTPNGHTRVQWHGNIVLNHEGIGYMTEGSIDHTGAAFSNNVIWDVRGTADSLADGVVLFRDDGTAVMKHNTFGMASTQAYVRNAQVDGTSPSPMTDSIFYGLGPTAAGALRGFTSDYNVFFDNAMDYQSTSAGASDWSDIDPIDGTPGNGTPALAYLLRIEDGSNLDGAASDGGDRGATIVYQYGVPGTLWGDPGWDELTTAALWPWPNEDVIHDHFASYDLHGVTGARGFAVPAQTLTDYIWEYLGNPSPY